MNNFLNSITIFNKFINLYNYLQYGVNWLFSIYNDNNIYLTNQKHETNSILSNIFVPTIIYINNLPKY